MSKKLLNEVHRFQELAGIKKEMRIGPDGSLMSDEEAVKQAFEGTTNRLGKIINALHKDPSYVRAKEALKDWIKDVSAKLNIDPDSVPINHTAFTGQYPALQALPVIRKIFVDLISGGEDEGELTEDDYDMGTPSGDTDSMNIAEDDFSGTMHAVEDDPVV